MAVIAGIPLYADATTIIPIAQVLIQKGAAIGTVLVFMMAVVGLSLPEMIILSRVMKKELIIRYVIFMFITFTIIGYFYCKRTHGLIFCYRRFDYFVELKVNHTLIKE